MAVGLAIRIPVFLFDGAPPAQVPVFRRARHGLVFPHFLYLDREQPYCRIANLVEAKIAGRQAASRYLKALVAIGVLREQAFGKEKLFVHPKLMTLLTRDSNAFQSYR